MKQPQRIQLTNDNTQKQYCDCGHDIFIQGVQLRYASPLVTGQKHGQLITVAAWTCQKCGKEFDKSKLV